MTDLDEIRKRFGHEINFIILKFHDLSVQERVTMAKSLIDDEVGGHDFTQAAIQLYEKLREADPDEVTKYMNDLFCGGEPVFDIHIVAGDHATKAIDYARHFREALIRTEDGQDYTLPLLEAKAV